MIEFTIFRNLYDNKTNKVIRLKTFDDFENMLYHLSKEPKKSKKDSHLISPACYKEDTNRRCNADVSYWSMWAAMDVDKHDFKAENLEQQLLDMYGEFRYVVYSTASSQFDYPKFRIVFPLTERVEVDDIKHFWYALNEKLGNIGDAQTKDLSRMFYIPADYAGANNFIFSNKTGKILSPKDLIAEYSKPVELLKKTGKTFLDRLPDGIKDQVIEHRKSILSNSNAIQWSSYNDCPFVNKKLIDNYKSIAHTDNSGRYAMIYKIMVSIAANAIKRNYGISTYEIVKLISELDMETGGRYKNRQLEMEADRALEYAYRNY
jgi:hypothetical protein